MAGDHFEFALARPRPLLWALFHDAQGVAMASFKLNVARIRGCPPAAELVSQMQEYGLPDSEEFGILTCSSAGDSAFGTLVRKTQQAVQRIDPETHEVATTSVERVTLYPFGIRPDSETLETYAGTASGCEQMGAFLSSCLALPIVVEGREIDLLDAVEKLSANANRFQLRSIRVSDYSANSFMIGPYAPKFIDTQHGLDFMQQYVESLSSVAVRFQAPNGRANATLSPKACFSFSCHEDDQAEVMSILRKLV
jgi:hypothetical protein